MHVNDAWNSRAEFFLRPALWLTRQTPGRRAQRREDATRWRKSCAVGSVDGEQEAERSWGVIKKTAERRRKRDWLSIISSSLRHIFRHRNDKSYSWKGALSGMKRSSGSRFSFNLSVTPSKAIKSQPERVPTRVSLCTCVHVWEMYFGIPPVRLLYVEGRQGKGKGGARLPFGSRSRNCPTGLHGNKLLSLRSKFGWLLLLLLLLFCASREWCNYWEWK